MGELTVARGPALRAGQPAFVADLDFMGERPRIDDPALTLYYTNSTFADGRDTADRLHQLRHLVDAYDSGLSTPLSQAERRALPLALARAPLCFIGMVADTDSEHEGRRLAAEMTADVAWALAIARSPARWQEAFVWPVATPGCGIPDTRWLVGFGAVFTLPSQPGTRLRVPVAAAAAGRGPFTQMNFAVILRAHCFNACGGPSNSTSPPALPPSGPRSMIQSACRITSR